MRTFETKINLLFLGKMHVTVFYEIDGYKPIDLKVDYQGIDITEDLPVHIVDNLYVDAAQDIIEFKQMSAEANIDR